MGEIVAAAVVGHVPTVMLDETIRRKLGGTGVDTTLVDGFQRLKAHFETKSVDTWVGRICRPRRRGVGHNGHDRRRGELREDHALGVSAAWRPHEQP